MECEELSSNLQTLMKELGENNSPPLEHPLQTPWSFWYDNGSARGASAEEFRKSLSRILSVDTVEKFWVVYNHMPCVSLVVPGYSYHLMRSDREPLWEDKANRGGGTWRYRVTKASTKNLWFQLIMAAVGEQLVGVLHEEDQIVGISVTVRERDDLFQIWNSKSSLVTEQVSERLLMKIRELTEDSDQSLTVHASFYKPHQAHQAYEG